MVRHVILGAGGSVGNALADELLKTPESTVVLVSRRGTSRSGCISAKLDLTNAETLANSLDADCVAYLTAGLPYDTIVWEREWCPLVKVVVGACVANNTPLIYLDNVYMYGKTGGTPMTEQSPIQPCSRKGKVRAEAAHLVLDALSGGRLRGCILRAADFYGPHCGMNSTINGFLLKPTVLGGKSSARWIGKSTIPHSFTYVPDLVKAMAYVGCHKEMWQRQAVWHAPTCADTTWTGEQWAKETAKQLAKPITISEMGPWMVRMSGLFVTSAAAAYEMLYQNMEPYIFESKAFEEVSGIKATPYHQGLAETIEWIRKQELKQIKIKE